MAQFAPLPPLAQFAPIEFTPLPPLAPLTLQPRWSSIDSNDYMQRIPVEQPIQQLKANDNSLSVLSLHNRSLGEVEGSILANILKVNSILKVLNLSYNQLKDLGGNAIADALQINMTLQHLDLSDNKLGVEACTALGLALKGNRGLKYLNLNKNEFGDKGVIALSDGLSHNRTLEELHLVSTSSRLESVFKALTTQCTLKVLDISNCFLGTDGGSALGLP